MELTSNPFETNQDNKYVTLVGKTNTYCRFYWATVIKTGAASTSEQRSEKGIDYPTPGDPLRKLPFDCWPPRTHSSLYDWDSPPHTRSVDWIACRQSGRRKSADTSDPPITASYRGDVLSKPCDWETGSKTISSRRRKRLHAETPPTLFQHWPTAFGGMGFTQTEIKSLHKRLR